ncbi:MAG: hypothetical protein VX244_01300 [Candidatus Neomarinimicrobiota bacterium]|nr:hypothetical protein [Candidatus Neomarinimicrobiota bacterium]
MPNPTAMIAMGGNALSPKGEAGTITQQFTHTRETLDGIGHFIERGYNLCINHGNGPQVGNELLRMDLTHDRVPPLPPGVCVAGTQGSIGFMIQQSLQNKLRDMNVDREVVTLVSQVIVDENDPSIKDPTKYVGARYSAEKEKFWLERWGTRAGTMAPRGSLANAGIHHVWKVHQNTGGSRHNCYCIRRRRHPGF